MSKLPFRAVCSRDFDEYRGLFSGASYIFTRSAGRIKTKSKPKSGSKLGSVKKRVFGVPVRRLPDETERNVRMWCMHRNVLTRDIMTMEFGRGVCGDVLGECWQLWLVERQERCCYGCVFGTYGCPDRTAGGLYSRTASAAAAAAVPARGQCHCRCGAPRSGAPFAPGQPRSAAAAVASRGSASLGGGRPVDACVRPRRLPVGRVKVACPLARLRPAACNPINTSAAAAAAAKTALPPPPPPSFRVSVHSRIEPHTGRVFLVRFFCVNFFYFHFSFSRPSVPTTRCAVTPYTYNVRVNVTNGPRTSIESTIQTTNTLQKHVRFLVNNTVFFFLSILNPRYGFHSSPSSPLGRSSESSLWPLPQRTVLRNTVVYRNHTHDRGFNKRIKRGGSTRHNITVVVGMFSKRPVYSNTVINTFAFSSVSYPTRGCPGFSIVAGPGRRRSWLVLRGTIRFKFDITLQEYSGIKKCRLDAHKRLKTMYSIVRRAERNPNVVGSVSAEETEIARTGLTSTPSIQRESWGYTGLVERNARHLPPESCENV